MKVQSRLFRQQPPDLPPPQDVVPLVGGQAVADGAIGDAIDGRLVNLAALFVWCGLLAVEITFRRTSIFGYCYCCYFSGQLGLRPLFRKEVGHNELRGPEGSGGRKMILVTI